MLSGTSSGVLSLNASAGGAVTNIGTGTTTGTVTFGGSGAQSIAIGDNAAGVKTITVGNNVTTSTLTMLSGTSSGVLSLNASAGGSVTNIGTGATTGTVTIGNSTNEINLPKMTASSVLLTDASKNITSVIAGTTGNYLRSDGTTFVSAPITQSQRNVAAPAGTTNTTGVMMGLAGAITPARSGTLMIIISGDIANSNGANGGKVQIRYGTGTAPANATALTGTAIGGQVNMTNGNATGLGVSYSDIKVPFSLNAAVSGLTIGTVYWIDVSLGAVSGGTATIMNISITVIEL